MKTKSKVTILATVCVLVLTGCSGGGGSAAEPTMVSESKSDYDMSLDSGLYSGVNSYSASESYDTYAEGEEYVSYEEPVYTEEVGVEEPIEPEPEIDSGTTIKDMLIYRGNVTISTKEFDKDLEKLKNMLESFDCFFEDERMWTDYSYDDRNLYNYSATIRVASKQYNKLLEGLNEIGTVTNLGSSCENVSAEYTDTVVAIDIYEAERDRYVNLLRTITDDQYAIEVQRELTDIELKLAQYRARKQNIETDVSYSYVTIDLSEVREYEQQTEYNDSFFKRLWNTIANTFFGFCTFLEGLLFFLIRISPYILLIFILYKIGLFKVIGKTKPIERLKYKYKLRKEKRDKEHKEMMARWHYVEDINQRNKNQNSSEGVPNLDEPDNSSVDKGN